MTPATSPENEFMSQGKKASVAYYSENVNAIIRNLLRDYIECCDALKISDEYDARIRDVYKNMVPVKIGSRGQILEWNEELLEADAKGAVNKLKQMGISKEEAIVLIERYWESNVEEEKKESGEKAYETT